MKPAETESMGLGQDRDTRHSEGPVAKKIEEQTGKIPSDTFLWGAVGCAGVSLMMQLTGRKETGNFVAAWVPTILTLGLYNKIVKTQGSEPR